MVKITAYDFSIYGGLKGVVEDISADTIKNERGESFYRVRVRTDRNFLGTEAKPLQIIPGMTAQVNVLTGREDRVGLPDEADPQGPARGDDRTLSKAQPHPATVPGWVAPVAGAGDLTHPAGSAAVVGRKILTRPPGPA